MSKDLYNRILEIARDYMGVAAEEYIRRRIRIVQRGLSPETIVIERLDRLAAGIEMTARGYLSPKKALAFRDAILAVKQEPVFADRAARSSGRDSEEPTDPGARPGSRPEPRRV